MIKPVIFFCSMLLALASVPGFAQKASVAVPDFEKGISANGIQILDVRTRAEFDSGHLRNAFLADWTNKDNFQKQVVGLDKNKPVYTYCKGGVRSSAAAAWLKENGFTEVYSLDGGIRAWQQQNKPVEEAPVVKQISQEEFFADSIPTDQTVLVDISAVWCAPCKGMEAMIRDLQQSATSTFKLVQIDGGEQESLAKELHATNFPTLIVYKNGKEVWRKEGVADKKDLQAAMQ